MCRGNGGFVFPQELAVTCDEVTSPRAFRLGFVRQNTRESRQDLLCLRYPLFGFHLDSVVAVRHDTDNEKKRKRYAECELHLANQQRLRLHLTPG